MTIGTATEVKESIGLETTALILGGFYFHEFIRFIDFDWKLLTRKADQNTFTARCVKAQLTQIDTGTSALAATCSSALIAVRVMVVWAWDVRIMTIVAILFLALFAIDIRRGLYRWHKPGNGSRPFRLWRILLNQGVLYILLVSATEVPALVFLLLNLNHVPEAAG
ncbi:hypothetical protein PENSPDRAFT_663782 [Peniophora sp. CONT]|nr:hypothetical protein PENSPDRAFT_663782 [Peniophora sp. CONT]